MLENGIVQFYMILLGFRRFSENLSWKRCGFSNFSSLASQGSGHIRPQSWPLEAAPLAALARPLWPGHADLREDPDRYDDHTDSAARHEDRSISEFRSLYSFRKSWDYTCQDPWWSFTSGWGCGFSRGENGWVLEELWGSCSEAVCGGEGHQTSPQFQRLAWWLSSRAHGLGWIGGLRRWAADRSQPIFHSEGCESRHRGACSCEAKGGHRRQW